MLDFIKKNTCYISTYTFHPFFIPFYSLLHPNPFKGPSVGSTWWNLGLKKRHDDDQKKTWCHFSVRQDAAVLTKKVVAKLQGEKKKVNNSVNKF